MIQFSFSSVLMTVLTSNLLLILVALFFRNEKTLARVGYRLTAVYCAVTLIRLLFPCELPFTKTVVLPSGISNLFALLRHPSSLRNIRINCLERISLESGHSLLPLPPDRRTIFIFSIN